MHGKFDHRTIIGGGICSAETGGISASTGIANLTVIMTTIKTANEPIGICAFCNLEARLHTSHVLPAFAFRWLRSRSGKGHLRSTDNPNRRIQDGPKLPWLCRDCESQFSRYETAFATKVFHPWQAGTHRIIYGEWLLKFCVSVSWRVLRFARERKRSTEYTHEQKALMNRAEARWRAFLRNEKPHPGEFEQHIIIFDFIEEANIPDLPNNFNRFMTGSIIHDIIGNSRMLMTFAKLGRFMIYGHIQKGEEKWEGTKVRVKHGLLQPGNIVVPSGLIQYFRQGAAQIDAAWARLSPAQRAKVDKNIIENIDQFVASDHFESIMADAKMFGIDAIMSKK